MERFQIKGAPTCRIVYPAGLFEKKRVKGSEGEPKYNAIILVPKNDAEKMSQLNEKFAEAFQELKNKGFSKQTPKGINPKNNCWQDGDEYADESGKEAFRGYMILKVGSRQFRPIVCDTQKRHITNGVPLPGVDVENLSDEELGDGDYIKCNVSFWTYKNPTAEGIGANIHALVRVAPGERIGGASNNVDDYIDFE